MPLFTDQLGRKVEINIIPKRIVSLVPSQTELLHYLGLEDEVIAITKFCTHPNNWFRTKQRIGGTKNLNIGKLKSLQPDLIVANREENVKEQVEELARQFPVWVSDVNTLDDAYTMISEVGSITGKSSEAERLVANIQSSFNQLPTISSTLQTAYLIWKDPYMTIGGDTFINDMLSKAGVRNVFEDKPRYPTITIEDLVSSNCQLLLLSSEPYPFKQAHIDELQKQLPATKILLVDGEMFSWYGSRLLQAPSYFIQLQNRLNAIM